MIKEKLVSLMLPYPGRSDRLVRVYIPEHQEGETFPAVYMTDGQNLFEDDTVQFGCWYTRETVRAGLEQFGKGSIIVGIHNDSEPLQRSCELTPKSMGSIEYPPEMPEQIRAMYVPEGETFADFVANTVMPAVEAQFPVKTGRENTAFCGSSSGGLESFFIALSHPEKFSAAGVFSPVFMMYDKKDLENWIRSKTQDKENLPYLDMYVGGGDELEKQLSIDFEWVSGILTECYPANQLHSVVIPENKHHESAWAAAFRDFLYSLYSRA